MNIFKRVLKFNKDAGTKLGQELMLPQDAINEIRMIQEELDELKMALVDGLVAYKEGGVKKWRKANSLEELRVEIADALGDIPYVVMGTAGKLGMDYDSIMDEVCTSNETKYTADKTLEKDENGKIKKGGNFEEPNLSFVTKVKEFEDA